MATAEVEGTLVSQDTTQTLQRLFTGHIVGQPAMGYRPLIGKVISATATAVVVTITTFSATASFTCRYEPRPQSTSPHTPPVGTTCLVVFPANEPEGYGWAIAFLGWP